MWRNEMPTISVVVLNYNGGAVLPACLRSVIELAWDDLEILVVDNASRDGSADQIAVEFGERVRVIRRSVNSPTAGRNEGFKVASGDYVLSLDNDIVLPDATVVHKAAAILNRFPKVGALSFKIAGPEVPNEPLLEHWWHPLEMRTAQNQFFYTDWFAEGAVMFRREALSSTGGYDETLFHGFESVDFALRLLEQGFDILYCPNLTSIELRVRGFQPVVRGYINYLSLRNKIWTAWKDYPLLRGVYFATTRSAAAGVRALRYGWADLWLKAVAEGFIPPRELRQKRKPISRATWDRIRALRKGKFCPQAGDTLSLETSIAYVSPPMLSGGEASLL
jgi:glycosyltransferase involved in cell wall biosynthesis